MCRSLALIIVFILLCLSPAMVYGASGDRDADLRKVEKKMMTTGEYRDALYELDMLVGEDPVSARLLMTKGSAYYGLMEYGKALEIFRTARENDPKKGIKKMLSYAVENIDKNRPVLDNIETEQRAMLTASEAEKESLKENMSAGHIVVLDSLLADKYYYAFIVIPHVLWLKDNMPDMEGIDVLAGDIYYSSFFYAQAAANYREALEKDPENIELCRKTADAYVGAGDFEAARKYYNTLIHLYKKDKENGRDKDIKRIQKIKQSLPERYKDISDLIQKGKFAEAEKMCRNRISINPGDYVAMTQMGRIYWEKGKKRTAINLFRKALKIAPDYPTAHLLLGKAYFFERKPKKGLREFDEFKEAMEVLPNMDEDTTKIYIQNLHYLCYMYYVNKKYEEAMAGSRRIIELDPDDQKAYYNLAVCYYVYEHNRSKAYNEFKKVIEIEPVSYIADKARYYIDYMRRNPDSRIIGDFGFLYEE